LKCGRRRILAPERPCPPAHSKWDAPIGGGAAGDGPVSVVVSISNLLPAPHQARGKWQFRCQPGSFRPGPNFGPDLLAIARPVPLTTQNGSDYLADLLFEHVLDDCPAILLAAPAEPREFPRLIHGDMSRIAGSLASMTACTTAGPVVSNAACNTSAALSGSSSVKPCAPQACA